MIKYISEIKIKQRAEATALVDNVVIETIEDLKKALKVIGYSDKAIAEITKWYARP